MRSRREKSSNVVGESRVMWLGAVDIVGSRWGPLISYQHGP